MPKPNSKTVDELQSARKALEPSVRAAFLAASISSLAEHASQGYKNDSLGKEHLLMLFEVVGSMSREASAVLGTDLATKTQKFKDSKAALRNEVIKGISPPSITIPLLESEIFSEDLFPKEAYLKVDAEAIRTDERNVFPAFLPSGKRKLMDPTIQVPAKKRTLPAKVQAPPKSKASFQKPFPPNSSNPIRSNNRPNQAQYPGHPNRPSGPANHGPHPGLPDYNQGVGQGHAGGSNQRTRPIPQGSYANLKQGDNKTKSQ